jgi:hypothetical protein
VVTVVVAGGLSLTATTTAGGVVLAPAWSAPFVCLCLPVVVGGTAAGSAVAAASWAVGSTAGAFFGSGFAAALRDALWCLAGGAGAK